MHLQNRHRYFEKYEARLTTLCQVIIPMFGTLIGTTKLFQCLVQFRTRTLLARLPYFEPRLCSPPPAVQRCLRGTAPLRAGQRVRRGVMPLVITRIAACAVAWLW